MKLSNRKKKALRELHNSDDYANMTPGEKMQATKAIKYGDKGLSAIALRAHETRRANLEADEDGAQEFTFDVEFVSTAQVTIRAQSYAEALALALEAEETPKASEPDPESLIVHGFDPEDEDWRVS